MVSHYLTIKLIGREHIPGRKTFHHHPMREVVVSGINHRFRWLSQSQGQITHVLLTRSPLVYPRKGLTARLACVKHAASVRPEPGSNSPLKNNTTPTQRPMRKKRCHPAKMNPDKNCQNYQYQRNPSTMTKPTPKRQIQDTEDGA